MCQDSEKQTIIRFISLILKLVYIKTSFRFISLILKLVYIKTSCKAEEVHLVVADVIGIVRYKGAGAQSVALF